MCLKLLEQYLAYHMTARSVLKCCPTYNTVNPKFAAVFSGLRFPLTPAYWDLVWKYSREKKRRRKLCICSVTLAMAVSPE